jgi:uncharacterized membrane protein (UPF0136 family)
MRDSYLNPHVVEAPFMILEATHAYLFAFGVLAIAGGAIGYIKAKSKPSLIAGGISGVLLLVAGWLVGTPNATAGLVLGSLISLALLGRFGPAFRNTKKVMPAGVMAVLGLGGVILTAFAFFQPGR